MRIGGSRLLFGVGRGISGCQHFTVYPDSHNAMTHSSSCTTRADDQNMEGKNMTYMLIDQYPIQPREILNPRPKLVQCRSQRRHAMFSCRDTIL